VGLIAKLLGKGGEPYTGDPVPGVGGYTTPRGPAGATGYPGSAPAAVHTHSQAPALPQTVTADQQSQVTTPGTSCGGPPEREQAELQAAAASTERRTFPRIGAGINVKPQRNSTQYAGEHALPEPGNRYVYGGELGGYRSYAFQRQMPYKATTRRKAGGPGALDGSRYYTQPHGRGAPGAIGRSRRQWRHRPTVFAEPGPWTANFYDTTEATGTPTAPGPDQSPDISFTSPDGFPNTNNGTWRLGG
jgi:hypothetical protein